MQIRYIPTLTMLIAGAITCILSIVNKFDNLYSLTILLVVLITFYIIGVIAKNIILKVIQSGDKKNHIEIEELSESEPEDKQE